MANAQETKQSLSSNLSDAKGNRVLVGVTNSDARWAPVLGYQAVRVNDPATGQLSLGVGPYVSIANQGHNDKWSGGVMFNVGVNRLWGGMGLDFSHKTRAQFAVGLAFKF